MKVKELIEHLSGMNPEANVMAIPVDNGGYLNIEDCEEEFSDLVSLGLSVASYYSSPEQTDYILSFGRKCKTKGIKTFRIKNSDGELEDQTSEYTKLPELLGGYDDILTVECHDKSGSHLGWFEFYIENGADPEEMINNYQDNAFCNAVVKELENA